MKAASRKLRITAGPASSMAGAEPSRRPVPIEPPTATMAIWPALNWRRSPCSCVISCSEGMCSYIRKSGKSASEVEIGNLGAGMTFVIECVRYFVAAAIGDF